MRETPFAPSDNERAVLRTVVSDIERELACLGRAASPAEHRSAIGALTTSWARLVELMALGVAPELRPCLHCGHLGRRAATRCGHCWAALAAEPLQ
jgi:hypothetical protein